MNFRTWLIRFKNCRYTFIVGVCWLAFILLFFAFFAGNFNFWQNLAIFIVSIIIAGGITGAMWIKEILK